MNLLDKARTYSANGKTRKGLNCAISMIETWQKKLKTLGNRVDKAQDDIASLKAKVEAQSESIAKLQPKRLRNEVQA